MREIMTTKGRNCDPKEVHRLITGVNGQIIK